MSFLGFGLHVVPGFANVGSGLLEIFMFLDFPNDAGFFDLPCVPDSSIFAVSFPLSSLLLFSVSVSFVSLASLFFCFSSTCSCHPNFCERGQWLLPQVAFRSGVLALLCKDEPLLFLTFLPARWALFGFFG